MRRIGCLALSVVTVAGCAFGPQWTEPMRPPLPVAFENPLLVPPVDPQVLWETLVEVIGDYFQIEREQPVRRLGGTFTEGRLDTFPEVGSTLFEPWRHDAANQYEKVEGTLQSIRRRAQIRVIPSQAGYSIEVAVFKELEDVPPSHAASAAATFRNDSTLTRVVGPVGEQEINKGWIALGRDPALEQRIIAQLRDRFGMPHGCGQAPAMMPVAPERIPTPTLPQAMPPSGASAAPVATGPLAGPAGVRDETAGEDNVVAWFTAYGPDDVGPMSYGDPPPMLPANEPLAFPRMATFEDAGGGCQGPLPSCCDPGVLTGPIAGENEPSENFFVRSGGRVGNAFKDAGTDIFCEIGGDYAQFYSVRGLGCLALSLGVAGVLANTSLDRSFQDWHDSHVHTPTLGHFVDVIRPLGDGTYMIPLFVLSAVYGSFDSPLPGAPVVGEWGNRTTRSLLVGGPLMLAFQFALGGSRPELATGTSHWNLFRDSHGCSGDAFIGGVAFINAAKMTDDVPLKLALYGASILPGYGRVVQDKHYLSQAILGWALAYLAADAVDRNGFLTQRCGLTPCAMEDGMGVGLMKQW